MPDAFIGFREYSQWLSDMKWKNPTPVDTVIRISVGFVIILHRESYSCLLNMFNYSTTVLNCRGIILQILRILHPLWTCCFIMFLEKFNPLLIIIPCLHLLIISEGKIIKTKLLAQSKTQSFFHQQR